MLYDKKMPSLKDKLSQEKVEVKEEKKVDKPIKSKKKNDKK